MEFHECISYSLKDGRGVCFWFVCLRLTSKKLFLQAQCLDLININLFEKHYRHIPENHRHIPENHRNYSGNVRHSPEYRRHFSENHRNIPENHQIIWENTKIFHAVFQLLRFSLTEHDGRMDGRT